MIPMGLKVLQDKNPVQYKRENNIVLTSKIVRAPPILNCYSLLCFCSQMKWGSMGILYETKN